jgi:tryptophan synthase alpha chain
MNARYAALKRPAYTPYVLLGFPTLDASIAAAKALIEEGVHGLELGFPFRDPAADGPVIQNAGYEALDAGFKISEGMAAIAAIRSFNADIPLTVMVYYNMVLARGIGKFCAEIAAAGADGILIPDLPPERAEEIAPFAKQHGIALILIAAPNTDDTRLALIKRHVGGFVYVVTRLGVTGSDEHYAASLESLFERVHRNVGLPALAGFGISGPDQAAKMIAAGADGVIVGSRLIDLIRSGWKGGALDTKGIRAHTRDMLEKL